MTGQQQGREVDQGQRYLDGLREHGSHNALLMRAVDRVERDRAAAAPSPTPPARWGREGCTCGDDTGLSSCVPGCPCRSCRVLTDSGRNECTCGADSFRGLAGHLPRCGTDSGRDEAREAASAPGKSCPTCVSAGGPYRCCPHCADDPIAHEGGQRNHHDLPCTLCIESPGVQGGREEAREAVARVLIEGLVTYAEAFASGWDNCPDIDWREAATIFVNDCEVANELLALPELDKLLRRPA